MLRHFLLFVFYSITITTSAQSTSDLFKFFSEFYYDIPKSESYVDQLRAINANADLGKAVIDDDENLLAEILDHPYLTINKSTNVELHGFGEYDWKYQTGYSSFQIELFWEPNLNNVNTFLTLIKSFPTHTKVQYSGRVKEHWIYCEVCTRNKDFNANFAQVDIYIKDGDDYEKYEDIQGQTFLIRLIVDFDHYFMHLKKGYK